MLKHILRKLWVCTLLALVIPFALFGDTPEKELTLLPELPKLPSEIWQTLLHGGRGDIILEAERATKNPPPAE